MRVGVLKKLDLSLSKMGKPKIGFCILQNPLEVGADKSNQILKDAIKELSNYTIDLIPFKEIVDSDLKAKKAGNFFYENDIDCLLIIEATYSYDFLALDILEYINVPIILWAIPGMDNGSLCGCQLLGVSLFEIGKDYKIFYSKVTDKKTHNKILSYSKASFLKRYLRTQKIGLIGYRMEGMTYVTFDEYELKNKFGPRVVHFGLNEIMEMSNKIDKSNAMEIWNGLKSSKLKIEVNDNEGIDSCKTYLTLKKIAQDRQVSGFAIECYPNFLGQFCLSASLLAKDNIMVGCEGDINSTLAMVILNCLTGEPIINTDFLNPDSENSAIFSHCGSADIVLCKDKNSVKLCPVRLQNSGVVVKFLPKLGDITLLNIVGRKDTYRISALEAYSQDTEMVFPGNPVSAKFSIKIDKFLDIIEKNAVGHHWMIVYGRVLDEIRYFCELTKVKFVEFP